MILADTSVWIDHLRKPNAEMLHLLKMDLVLRHPLVIGEVMMGSLSHRETVLYSLNRLLRVIVVESDAVVDLVDERHLYSRGVGFVDAHLLASVLKTPGTELWTRDRRLAQVAREQSVNYEG